MSKIDDKIINTDFIVNLIIDESKFKKTLINAFKKEVKKEALALMRTKEIPQDSSDFNHAQDVLALVANTLNVSPILLKTTNRKRELVEARQIYSYIIRKISKVEISFEKAGAIINRDHATIIYGSNTAQQLMITDKSFSKKMQLCLTEFNTRFNGEKEFIDKLNHIPQL